MEEVLISVITDSLKGYFNSYEITKTSSDKRTKGLYGYYLDEDGYDVNKSLIKSGIIDKDQKVVAILEPGPYVSLSIVNNDGSTKWKSEDHFIRYASGGVTYSSHESLVKSLLCSSGIYKLEYSIDYDFIYRRLLDSIPKRILNIPDVGDRLCGMNVNNGAFNCGAFMIGHPAAKTPVLFLVTLYLYARSTRKKLVVGSDKWKGHLYNLCEELSKLSEEQKKEARSLINNINFNVSIGEGVLNTNSTNIIHPISIKFFYD